MASVQVGSVLRQIQRLFSGGTVGGLSDAALLHRFAGGRDEDAFAALLARHGPMVLAVCRGVLRDSCDAEDAFQATFLALTRQARSLRVDGSLGGWLHRVAYRIAVRANVEAARRRARERRGVDIDAIVGPDEVAGERRTADLHEEVARLPDAYRRAVVLCYLEGMSHAEAAREIGCGEATLRRRLARARERLRIRLDPRGVAGVASLPVLPMARIEPVPPGWMEAAVRTAVADAGGVAARSGAGRLAAAVLATTNRARRLKAAVLLIASAGLATAWAVDPACLFGQARPFEEPGRGGRRADAGGKPAAPKPDAVPNDGRVHWVHLKSDTGTEIWANLDTGRELRQAGNTISMLEAAAHDLYTFEGRGPIIKTKARYYADITDRDGRHIPPAVSALVGSYDGKVPRRATELERKTHFFVDYDIETGGGRRLGRTDQYGRDALGEARLEKQTWVDLGTGRIVLTRQRLQVADQHRFHRVFETTEFDYPASGPADLLALGVPRGTPVIDREKAERSWKWADQAPEVRRAIAGQAEAIRRFPRHFRAVTQEPGSQLALEYWSSTADYIDLWCASKTSDVSFDLDDKQPRQFRADHQDTTDLPGDLRRAVFNDRHADLPADRIAAWFPFDRSVNISLLDGKRTYNLTRLSDGEDKPRKTEVHVLSGGFDELPGLVRDHWPVVEWNRRELSAAAPRPDTPPGCFVIRTERDDLHNEFTVDPARDFIAIRQVEWRRWQGDKWERVERRAARWKRLPGGSWYVAAWEQRHQVGLPQADGDGKPDDEEDDLEIHRLDVTPLEPGQFPKEIFDGARFLEAAKKAGAVIEADASNEVVAPQEPDQPEPEVKLIGKASESDLAGVGRRKKLESLTILSTNVTDAGLAHLKGLGGLRTLVLNFDPRGIGQDFAPVRPGDGAEVGDAGLAHLRGILKGLESLDLNLGGTRVADAGLEALDGLTCEIDLDLSGTRVTGAGLAHLQGLTGLRRLRLQNLAVTGAGLARLDGLDGLELLSLANTDIGDGDLVPLKRLPGLEVLFLNNTKVSDIGIAAHLTRLTGLVYLDLSGTKVSDAGLSRLASLGNLKRLTIKGVAVTTEAVESLQDARPDLRVER